MNYLFAPPPVYALPIQGQSNIFPVQRLFFVGRNYAAHAAEMGFAAADKSKESPFYFTKSPSALTASGSQVPYPPGTSNYHHEIELVVALGAAGFELSVADAPKCIYGYACGLDMTRRDLQFAARDKGRPWSLGKDCENSAVASAIVPMPGQVLDKGAIELSVNGALKQKSDLSCLIWNVAELIADLSRFYHLRAGDLIYTGTPEGVGPVVAGDHIEGRIEGVGQIGLFLT